MNFSAFPLFRDWQPQVPVVCVTPGRGGCIHRFFDTCPISPSGRYLALFRVPFEDRLNHPLEEGEIVLVDLLSGEERTVARTRGWEMQLGANLNWGEDDHCLVFNDVDESSWQPVLVKLDPLRGTKETVKGGVYHVSPDGRYAASASLEKMVRCQHGYGVRIPEERISRNIGMREDDGLFITDLRTGDRRLILSLRDACRHIPELQEGGTEKWEIYGFHSKWSPDGKRIIFTVRRYPAKGPLRFNVISSIHPEQQMKYDVLTLKPDGTDIHNAVPARRWEQGGHHVNWYPDGQAISMNLGGFGKGLFFVRVNADGTDLRPILEGLPGSGHPTVHANGKYILTDSYANSDVSHGDGTVPLRWINLGSREDRWVIRIGARTAENLPSALRVDPHPAWDQSGRFVVFNGVSQGDHTRRVFVADFQSLLG